MQNIKMDEITKQIQQLKVTNRHKCVGEAPAFLKDAAKIALDDAIDCRKSAPSVPPKPNKKSPNYVEVFTFYI